MRYDAPKDSMILRKASFGPAALAARTRTIKMVNLGLPQARYFAADMMRRGGSMGAMGSVQRSALGCLCGPGDPGFMGSLAVPNVVKIGPIAARMISLRKAGATPQAAYLDAMMTLNAQGEKIVTPEIHLQLAAGLQPSLVAQPIAIQPVPKALPGGLTSPNTTSTPQTGPYYINGNYFPNSYGVLPAGATPVTQAQFNAILSAGAVAARSGAGLKGLLGALGLAPVAGAAITGGSIAASAVGTAAAGALGIGAGIALGQTMIPIPVVGAVIGAVVFEAMQLMKRHVGKAEAAWNNPGFYNTLRSTAGREYDEQQFSEAFKGMMDTGNNIVPGCGADRHKNPDCLLGPMAAVIAQGYLSQAVPLSANTSQVFNTVVKPWLMSGAGGLVNGAQLAKEPIQMLMMQAAADRYLAGQAMTRGDMPAYAGQGGAHTPTLVQALQPILQQPTTTTPNVTSATPAVPPTQIQTPSLDTAGSSASFVNPAQVPVIGTPSGGVTLVPQYQPSPGTYLPSGGGGSYINPVATGPAVGYGPVTSPQVLTAPLATAGGTSLPVWIGVGLAVIAAGFALARPATKSAD